MIVRLAPFRRRHWMCVVKTDEALASDSMHRQRISESVRARSRYLGLTNLEFDPVIAVIRNHEHLPIQIKQRVEAGIPWHRHDKMLSVTDNLVKGDAGQAGLSNDEGRGESGASLAERGKAEVRRTDRGAGH